MKYLYKYPLDAFPYEELKEQNQKRTTLDPEYELSDTQVFQNGNYFDIVIEYAKATSEDTCIRITATNRSQKSGVLHILPHLWFRNQFSWDPAKSEKPEIRALKQDGFLCLETDEKKMAPPSNLLFLYQLGKRYLYGPSEGGLLFTNNENDFVEPVHNKEAFHRMLVNQEKTPRLEHGTKATLHYTTTIAPQKTFTLHLRLSPKPLKEPLQEIDAIMEKRKKEADAFYQTVHPKHATDEEKMIQRQALAGMMWSKQIYLFDVEQWLHGDPSFSPPVKTRETIRNTHWKHLNSMRILSMPDKWEYPWFAAWDLAFHTLTFALVDIHFAKEQLWLLLFDQFQHPNGAIPAYEWEFSDLNPPVQAWAALQLFHMEKEKHGVEDFEFLKKCFLKLLINFSWWVNRVDSDGWNVFEGGFLGLDNITLIERSNEVKESGTLRQSDGTGWMAMFCLNLMRIALILSKKESAYASLAVKFFEHFVYIAHAMKKRDNQYYELWDEEDGFFYDVLSYPDGKYSKFKVRSLVGIIPLYAVDILTEKEIQEAPEFEKHMKWFLKNRFNLVNDCIFPHPDGYLLSLVSPKQLTRVLEYAWNPNEFKSPFGLRSLSKYHEKHPFTYKEWAIGYEPAAAQSKIKGGNSNWRGPVWMPTNYLFVHSLCKFASALPLLKVDSISLHEMACYFANQAIALFKKDLTGKRPFASDLLNLDPHFQDLILFYEYYHGDTGQGLGASHQTGWSGLVANLIDEFRSK
jgi:hypothetical protein